MVLSSVSVRLHVCAPHRRQSNMYVGVGMSFVLDATAFESWLDGWSLDGFQCGLIQGNSFQHAGK